MTASGSRTASTTSGITKKTQATQASTQTSTQATQSQATQSQATEAIIGQLKAEEGA